MTQDQEAPQPAGAAPGRRTPAPIIAIDGPVASGKTAVGLHLARALGYRLVDTGMTYRALTCLALNRAIDVEDEAAVTALADAAHFEIGQPGPDGGATISADGQDVTAELRSAAVDRSVSFVSRLPGVRRAMIERQRALAGEGGVIMLGRDIGSVVLPDAPVKIYLDATPAERARRRHLELAATGVDRPQEEIARELEQRDAMDRQRHVSPLKPAEDAVVIDTDGLTLEQVIARVREIAGVAP